jgi:hypothetical protein
MKKVSILSGIKILAICILLSTFAISDGNGETANLPNGKAYVNCGGWLNLRQSPSKSSKRLAKLYKNDEVNIIGRKGEWYQIDSPKKGWVMAEFVSGNSPGAPENDSNLTPDEQVKIGRDMFTSAENAEITKAP